MTARIGSVTTVTDYNTLVTTTLSALAVPAGYNRAVAVIVRSNNPGLGANDVIPSATCDAVAMEELAGSYPALNTAAQSKMFGAPIANGDSAVDIVVTFGSALCARVVSAVFLENVDPADLADAVTNFTNGGGTAAASVTVVEDDTANGYVLAWCCWRTASTITATDTGEGTEIANAWADQIGAVSLDTGLAVVESTGDASVVAAWTLSAVQTAEARGLRFNHLLGSAGGGGAGPAAKCFITESRMVGERMVQ